MKGLEIGSEVELHLSKLPGQDTFQLEADADSGDSFLGALMVLVHKYANSQGISESLAVAILTARMLGD